MYICICIYVYIHIFVFFHRGFSIAKFHCQILWYFFGGAHDDPVAIPDLAQPPAAPVGVSPVEAWGESRKGIAFKARGSTNDKHIETSNNRYV